MSLPKLPQALLAFFLLAASALQGKVDGFVLEMQMANPTGGSAAIFYDIGQWYSQRDSVRVATPPSHVLQTYRFELPPEPIHRLRFDLADHAGPVQVGRLRLLTRDGRVLDAFGPEFLQPMSHIESLRIQDGVAVVQAGPDNPMLLIDREEQPVTEKALGRQAIGPSVVLVLAVVVLLAMAWPLAVAVRALPKGGWVFLGAFLIVFGFRLYWLKAYSRPMPYWDEWEMDGRDLLMPLRGHFLDWQALFVPQSEHRTVVSRLAALGASILNGEWDPRVEMVFGAAMYAASLALLCAAAAWRARLWLVGTLVTVAVGACPFDSHNLFCGDQCQMYALNLMAMVVLVLATAPATQEVIVAFGVACAVSLFTMASGCVAPLLGALVAVVGNGSGVPPLRLGPVRGGAHGPHALAASLSASGRCAPPKKRGAIVLIGIVAGVVGLLLYKPAPFQAPEYARTWSKFASALVGRLAWPLSPHDYAPLLIWGPWLLFIGFAVLRRGRTSLDLLLLALGLWLLINAAALAHGRPFDQWPFNNKYYTAMLLIVPVSLYSLLRLRPLAASVCATALALPMLFAAYGWLASGAAFSAQYGQQQTGYDVAVRPFLRTDDRAALAATSPDHLPYWNGAELAAQLDSPLMQPWLPAVLRQCLSSRPGSPYPARIEPGPLTWFSRTLMKLGLIFAAIGALVLLSLHPSQNR